MPEEEVVIEKTEEGKESESSSVSSQGKTTAELQAELDREKESKDQKSDETLPNGVTRTEDGTLSVKRGDSTYSGKTLDELFKNVMNGIEEKDSHIKRVKAARDLRGIDAKTSRGEGESSVPDFSDEEELLKLMPDEQVIGKKEFESRGLKPEMASWGRDEWRKFQDDQDLRDYEVSDIRSLIREARKSTDQEVRARSVDFINTTRINAATDNVGDMLVDSGLDPDQYATIYQEVLSSAYADPKNRNGEGVLKDGAIEREMAKRLLRSSKSSQKSTVEKKVDEEKRRAEELKKKIRTSGGESSDKFNKQKPEPRTIREAHQRLREQLAQGFQN